MSTSSFSFPRIYGFACGWPLLLIGLSAVACAQDQPISILEQPQDQQIRAGGAALFEAVVAGSGEYAWQWHYEDGREGRFNVPFGPRVEGPGPPRLVVDVPPDRGLALVVSGEITDRSSRRAYLEVEPGLERKQDQGFEPEDGLVVSDGLVWQDFVPTVPVLDHVRLALDSSGWYGQKTAAVSLLTSEDVEIARYTVTLPEGADHRYKAWDGWTTVPLGVQVRPGERYRLMIDLRGPDPGNAVFRLRAGAGDPYPRGESSLSGHDFGFYTFGPSERWVEVEELEMGAAGFARYDGIEGEGLAGLPGEPVFPHSPDAVGRLERFEYTGSGSDFGIRAWGWIVPEASGNYTFSIAADGEAVLRLSSHEDPVAARVVARASGATDAGDFNLSSEQRTDSVHLQAGFAYYLEADMAGAATGGALAVAWEGPGIEQEVIPGRVLGLAPPRITLQPGLQAPRPDGVALFEVQGEGGPGTLYQWYEGEPGDRSKPVGEGQMRRRGQLASVADGEEARFWVEVANDVGTVWSEMALRQVDPAAGLPARLVCGVEPGEQAIEGGIVSRRVRMDGLHLDHLRLPLYVVGKPNGSVRVLLRQVFSDPIPFLNEVASYTLGANEVNPDGWTIVPIRTEVFASHPVTMTIQLGVDSTNDGTFGIRTSSGVVTAGDARLVDGDDFAFHLHGTPDDWYVQTSADRTSFSDYREAKTITVDSNAEWTLWNDASWLTATMTPERAYSGMLELRVAPYRAEDGDFGPRTADIYIGDRLHTVTQEAIDPAISMAPAGSIGADGGEYLLPVASNLAWSASVEDPGWVQVAGDLRNQGNVELRFNVDPNPDPQSRSTTIRIADREHRLSQEGAEANPYDEDLVAEVVANRHHFGLYTQDELEHAANGARDEVLANPREWGLFTEAQLEEQFGGYVLVQPALEGPETLNLRLLSSSDLRTWNAFGEGIAIPIEFDGETRFYRVVLNESEISDRLDQ